jgi:hypothetical protein
MLDLRGSTQAWVRWGAARQGPGILRLHAAMGSPQQPTARTLAPVHMEPMLSMSTSFLASLLTCREGCGGGEEAGGR